MARSTVHYADNETNNILKRLHNKLRPAGTPVQRVEYIIELLLLRIFEIKLRHEKDFEPLRNLFKGDNYKLLFSHLVSLTGDEIKNHLNKNLFPFYGTILSKSRKVYDGNLPQKVQDQLILIEEVFANSSFTTNVQSGNMSEVIGLITDIDENVILKTDILGDAIESALSETGGTQDIGLYRTPEHIRQLMVAMVDPDFTDTIFDPACGTGGFLFDSYQYVLEKATKDEKWPSQNIPPSHPELIEYFKKYFRQFKANMPNVDIANRFYREGIGGIEYMGMIRKMAAINLYIRGLNPANILQGDSLHLYEPAMDCNSKSIVIANPPFGAKRDQPAYPNIWEEYARESETTILFVKLMFDLLKKGGRCAVVVSEGFLTWDKASARAMRKMLLDEANLKAIISVPQGVFISKSGQGAKTSILYFEKGTPTEWIWYYKIENDGFSMGINRKPITGCQIPEIIEVFSNYIKYSKIPPETKNSFVIPVEWIKTIDPRLKERIRKITKEHILTKSIEKRKKLITQLEEKKSKNNDEAYNQKLWQFDNVLENKIQNETSKRIEKEHLYSFNLNNYVSNLSKEQIEEWQKILADVEPVNNNPIDIKYNNLLSVKSESALKILSSFNPRNSLEIDIAREYLGGIDSKDVKQSKLDELLKRGLRYPRVKLGNLLIPKFDKIKKEDYARDLEIVKKVTFSDGVIHFRENKETGMDLYKASVGDLITSKINLHQGAVAIASTNLACSTHYQIYSIIRNKVLPEFLLTVLRSPQLLKMFETERNKGIKNEQGPGYLFEFTIPLPNTDIQQEIINKIVKYKMIIASAKQISEQYEPDFEIFTKFERKPIFEFATLNPKKELNNLSDEDLVSFVPMEAIDEISGTIKDKIEKKLGEVKNGYTYFAEGDVLFAKITPCMENGKVVVANDLKNNIGFGTTELHVLRTIKDKALPEFIFYLLRTKYFRNLAKAIMTGASGHKRVPENFMKEFKYPIPPVETQRQVVEQLDDEMEAVNKVRFLKKLSENRIEQILSEVWQEDN